ncbi:MerR family transcriptional regulator [Agromyces intestinalis]|uniref:MerR family transcriptional regulator n=1 Tax=Agromyces intestinalis TaxID=2592652 RepID=A0A5C1YFF1_9MICO|nr:MerR family transcriptional regulator [Agromyces intestinalis]QEO14814.1 MerR family transcriptional regulator [Agromyces intestinalis]
MDWSIQEVARLAGTTSRTLRHYDDLGLLPPSRIGPNGYRYYDQGALVRLQRILLLRDLGLGLPAIAEVLDGQQSEARALAAHLEWLRQERERLARQIASVEKTMHAVEGDEQIMAQEMFDGFDHTQYREEVEQRWGADAYARGDRWWRELGAEGQRDWTARVDALGRDWTAAAESGVAPDSETAQVLAARHVEWLRGIPGTPAATPGGDLKGYVVGLGEMYVADERFAANYGGEAGATFVRDALRAYAEANL